MAILPKAKCNTRSLKLGQMDHHVPAVGIDAYRENQCFEDGEKILLTSCPHLEQSI